MKLASNTGSPSSRLLVPARLSALFFFDGEKIKSIAEDLSSNAAIADAIQSLLGIDSVLAPSQTSRPTVLVLLKQLTQKLTKKS